MGRDLIQHAVESRSPWVLLIVTVTVAVVVLTAAVKILTPVVIYPFL